MLPLATFAPVLGCPLDALGVYPDLPLVHGARMFLQHLLRQADDVLSLVVLDQVQVLQSGNHVLLPDAGQLTHLTAVTSMGQLVYSTGSY